MNELNGLPTVFMLLIGLSLFIYAALDGYDLGVGILLPLNKDSASQRNTMIASIGPFWDANETWLVLAVGLLLIAFPEAHNTVLRELYLPATFLLLSLILRGVAFDFRAKAITKYRTRWDVCFKLGSIGAALTQGYMLGRYVLGFDSSMGAELFAWVSALCVTSAYTFIGAAWLVMKTDNTLQKNAIFWARYAAWLAAIGIILVSIINPMLSERVFDRWFSFPGIILLSLIATLSALSFALNDKYLRCAPQQNDAGCWIPFASASAIFFLCFLGLAYSFFPYIIPGELTIWEAASAEESLLFVFYGASFVIPSILAYTVFSYRVFWGKAQNLTYY